MSLRLLLAALFAAGSFTSLHAQSDAPPPAHIVPIVIKLDDVRTNASGWLSERWRRVGKLAVERKIKVSLGVIADSLEGDKPAYFDWLHEMQASGQVEFWFHGYDHAEHVIGDKKAAEFTGRSYEEQKERFVRSQELALARLGVPFKTYGPPGGGNLYPSDEDLDVTARVLSEDPVMSVWLYPQPMDARGKDLTAAGKITVLERVWKVNIEQPLFVPNFEKFVSGYNQYAAKRRYFVIQGHPNKWDDARWAEFVKIVDYITEHKIPTVTPGELAPTLLISAPKQ